MPVEGGEYQAYGLGAVLASMSDPPARVGEGMTANPTRDAVLAALIGIDPDTAERVADLLAGEGVFIPMRKVAAEDVNEEVDPEDPLWSEKADYYGARQASMQIQIYSARMIQDAQAMLADAHRRLEAAGG